MAEAMASGTPVLALREGSGVEIIEDVVTGFLCDDVADMAAAIGRATSIARAGCRARAIQRLSAVRMVADHVPLFLDVIASHGRHGSPILKTTGVAAGLDALGASSRVAAMSGRLEPAAAK